VLFWVGRGAFACPGHSLIIYVRLLCGKFRLCVAHGPRWADNFPVVLSHFEAWGTWEPGVKRVGKSEGYVWL